MRQAFGGALVGLCIALHPAWSQDIAAQPPYPVQNEPAAPKAKPKPKLATAKPATPAEVKPVEAKPAEPKPAETPPAAATPLPKPAPVRTAARGDARQESKPDVKPETKPVAVIDKPDPSDPLAALPPAERAPIRAALLWSAGEDAKPAAGEDAITAAIKAYQKRNKAKVTGTLSDSERADLLAAAKKHEDEFGWTVLADPTTGIRMGLPLKFAPQASEAKNGTRWSSRHGEIQVETFRLKTTETLGTLFENEKKAPRKIESSYQRPDGFFVSGLQGLKQFAVRAQLRNGELRGYTVRYDQAMEGIMLPVLPAIANAFSPFPAGATPIAALSQPVDYGTGLVVTATGYIVTDRRFAEGCAIVTIPGFGDADRVAVDEAHGLALLRVYGRQDLKPVELTAADAATRDLRLIGVPDPQTQGGGGKLSEIKAQLNDGGGIRLRDSAPFAGFSGAAALDQQDRVLGIIKMYSALASAAPAGPSLQLVPASTIRDFLTAHRVALAPATGNAKSSVVRVICVRQ